LEQTIEQLRAIYGEITVHWGPEHDYLGMALKYNTDQKKITLSMRTYIEGCIKEFEQENPEQVVKVVTTPATENLFCIRVDTDAVWILKQKAVQFHSTVAKLLFLAKRGRPDILLAVSFLTTRVKKPDDDDWKKLVRVLGY
jgi:hypothetical protein